MRWCLRSSPYWAFIGVTFVALIVVEAACDGLASRIAQAEEIIARWSVR